MSMWSDTLKPKGKYEQRRIAAITAFWAAVIYAFTPAFVKDFEVKEFVFWGFITFAGASIGMRVLNKKEKNEDER